MNWSSGPGSCAHGNVPMYSVNVRDHFNCSLLLFSWPAPRNRCGQTEKGGGLPSFTVTFQFIATQCSKWGGRGRGAEPYLFWFRPPCHAVSPTKLNTGPVLHSLSPYCQYYHFNHCCHRDSRTRVLWWRHQFERTPVNSVFLRARHTYPVADNAVDQAAVRHHGRRWALVFRTRYSNIDSNRYNLRLARMPESTARSDTQTQWCKQD